MRFLLALGSIFLPWSMRRRLLNRFFGFRIHEDAHIGLSWVFPTEMLEMGSGSRIGHLNVIRSLDTLEMGESAMIGGLNWITANFAAYDARDLDQSVVSRDSRLSLGKFSSLTTRHYLDVSDAIQIGDFTDVAGLRSVLLTHQFDLHTNRQSCRPIVIGAHCFLSTNAVILGGASLPHHSILGAGSVLVHAHETPYRLYAGSPATIKREYDADLAWFNRTVEKMTESRKGPRGIRPWRGSS